MDAQTLSYYEKNSGETAQRFEGADLSWLRLLFEELLARGSKLLEVGCGSGRDAALLLAAGYDVTATDGSIAMLDEAARLHPELDGRLVHVQLPARLPAETATLDSVYSIAALMHLETPEISKALTEMARVTKVDGSLVLSVPARRKGLDSDGRDSTRRYFNMLSRDEWLSLCAKAGYESIEVRTNSDSTRHEIAWWTLIGRKGSMNQ